MNMSLKSKLSESAFETKVRGVETKLFFLKNKNGMEIAVTNFGARVVELWAPDKNGEFKNIVLGHDTIEEYVNYKGERFLGAAIGRFGNRIDNGKFELGGKEYDVTMNEGTNCLHGGRESFDMVVWEARRLSDGAIEFHYLSKDGEEGFPGNLDVTMKYELTDGNEFVITYEAVTDKDTVVNLTHHSFFNLHGEGADTINDHVLRIAAEKFLAVDKKLIPTGEIMDVKGTPMDFTEPAVIGGRVDDDFGQLAICSGYDHCWVLDRERDGKMAFAASVHEPESGRYMEVWTTEPAIQFYGGNFFDGSTVGFGGKPYTHRSSLALETQHYPDSPNHPSFPSTLLRPGETYRHVCAYKFGVK